MKDMALKVRQNFEIPSHYFIEFAICVCSLLLLCASRQLEPVKCSCNYASAQDKSSTDKIEAASSQGNVWHAWSNSRHALVTSTLTPQNKFPATSEYSQGERKMGLKILANTGLLIWWGKSTKRSTVSRTFNGILSCLTASTSKSQHTLSKLRSHPKLSSLATSSSIFIPTLKEEELFW
jgi:hypothetical protein